MSRESHGGLSVFTVTNIPQPKILHNLSAAQLLAEQLDGHVSVFPSVSAAESYLQSAGSTYNGGLQDLFQTVGAGESTGKGKELFACMITSDCDLRLHFCSRGLDKETRSLLVDLTLDALSLPGAVQKTLEESHFEQLTSAFITLASGSRADEGGTRDLQWMNAKRTSLAQVKSEGNLIELLGRLMEDHHDILQKRTVVFQYSLENNAWRTPEDARIMGKMNLLNRIGSDTYFLYICDVLHLAQVSICEDWETAQVELNFSMEKTNRIRGNNVSRWCALAEIYCFMRDLQK